MVPINKIRILDSLTANKIAAGEIVEGPASVVKELVENSLDAQANNIEIEITDGGLNLIRIIDNGLGMTKEDALLAFERYATSKINAGGDLDHINTFGFRGEALPAIASVSNVILTTKSKDSACGFQLKLIGGKLASIEEVAFGQGSSMEVKNIFFNTPARRKFLKGAGYEAGKIVELITKYSLGHPSIRFKLISNQKTVYDTLELKSTESRLINIYGDEMGSKFLYIPKQNLASFTLEAWLAPVSFNRNTRNQQTIFINGRMVRSIELSKALEEAYHSLLPKGRFPLAVLRLQIDPFNLDVNIHPAKLEVKIFKIKEIQAKIIEIFRERLLMKDIKNYQKYKLATPKRPDVLRKIEKKESPSNEYLLPSKKPKIGTNDFQQMNFQETEADFGTDFLASSFVAEQSLAIDQKSTLEVTEKIQIRNIFDLIPIGQLNNSFILAQNKNALFIIDQHTAHERILYERFFDEVEKQTIIKSDLLIPLTLNLTGKQEGILLKNIIHFHDLGFILESFGPRTYLLRSLPMGLLPENAQSFFSDLLDELERGINLSLARIKEKIIITASCRGAIKANQQLTKEEILHLFQELAQVKNPHTCPHGRPIIHQISMQELYKIFQRGEFTQSR